MGTKGRKPIILDRDVLARTVEAVEAEGKVSNRTQLYHAISQSLCEQGITASTPVIVRHIEQFAIPIKTPKGERGGTNALEAARVARKEKSGRKKSPDSNMGTEELMISRLIQTGMDRPANRTRVKKAAASNKKAILELHCLECVGGSPSDVRDCTVKNCFSYHIRPYQNKRGDISEGYQPPPLGEVVEVVCGEGLPQ